MTPFYRGNTISAETSQALLFKLILQEHPKLREELKNNIKTGTIFCICLFLYQPTWAGTQVFCYIPKASEPNSTEDITMHLSVINFHTKFTYSTGILCILVPCTHSQFFFKPQSPLRKHNLWREEKQRT